MAGGAIGRARGTGGGGGIGWERGPAKPCDGGGERGGGSGVMPDCAAPGAGCSGRKGTTVAEDAIGPGDEL